MKPALSENLFGRTVRITAALIVACSSSIHAQSTQSPRIFQGVEIGTGIFGGKSNKPYDKKFGLSAILQWKLQLTGYAEQAVYAGQQPHLHQVQE